jgi:hypothetical protein
MDDGSILSPCRFLRRRVQVVCRRRREEDLVSSAFVPGDIISLPNLSFFIQLLSGQLLQMRLACASVIPGGSSALSGVERKFMTRMKMPAVLFCLFE